MSSLPTYGIIAEEAVNAFHRGQHRRAADKYLEATLAAPSPWSSNRYQIFTGYTSILRESYFTPSSDDLEALGKLARNKKEAILFRTEAAYTLGLLQWDVGNRTEAAEQYRTAIWLGREKATEKERKKRVISINGGGDAAAQPFKNVGTLIDETVAQVETNLARLEARSLPDISSISMMGSNSSTSGSIPSPPPPPMMKRSDGSTVPLRVRHTPIPLGPLPVGISREDMGRLLAVGGGECDHCHKTLQELGVHHLRRCTACQRAFYCSEDCQKKQWKAGHKQACRQPGQWEAGDYVRLEGLTSRPELNGTVVQVVQLQTEQQRVEVKILGGERSISVPQSKLQHLRPLK
jgi:hypothetical protein